MLIFVAYAAFLIPCNLNIHSLLVVTGQMLNCCIERRRARDEARKAQEATKQSKEAESELSAKETSQGKSWESWSDSEEEFYECLSEQGEDGPQTEAGQNGASRAEGRLHPYNNLTLLHSSEPLYVPVTQVPPTLFC